MRPAAVITLSFSLGLALIASASAQDIAAPSAKRVLADCMLKRMSAEKTLSYNDATKACKEQAKNAKPVTAANTVEKPLG